MFCEFYKLREQPFGVTPDPRFLYFGASHREALASLLYAIETRRGFSALVAEPGMGKTSLIFRMLDSLHDSARTAFLFQTENDSRLLLRSLLRDLGISATDQDPVAMHEALNEGLLQELHAGRQVVVVIDEAQNLDNKVLETVRLLSNFETATQKLMHIVLAGQPGLAEKLSESGMVQLRQRVSTMIRLQPLRPQEVAEYIEHRLGAAGHEGPALFSSEALEIIARVSQGTPRNVNSLCFQALSIGFAMQAKRIGAEIMREVVSDIDFSPHRPARTSFDDSPAWPPRKLDTPMLPVEPPSEIWNQVAPSAPRSSRKKWLAAVACISIVPLSMVVLSNSKSGFADTAPGRLSASVVNAVLSSSDPNADFVPPWPDKLKPPSPPALATPLGNSSNTSAPEPVDGPATSTAEPAGDPFAFDRAQSATASSLASRSESPRNNTFSANRREPRGPESHAYAAPSRVKVLRTETVFQFAQDVYGQSNWKVIEAICAANPDVHGPYSILKTGQWVKLPSDLVSVTANNNARPAIGRTH